jgi:F1F0 ATPase subunit 2
VSWIVAVGAGTGLGLAYFGGLWLTVRRALCRPSGAALVPASGAVRLILLGAGLAALSRQGAGNLMAALGGLWLSRWFLIRRLGGLRHGR